MDNEIDIRSLIAMIRRQIWLILSVVIGITAITSAAVYSITPKYSATALVFVDTSSKNLLDPQTSYSAASSDNARVDSEVRILTSNSVLLDVINDQNLVQDPEFGVQTSLTKRILSKLHLSETGGEQGADALSKVLNRFKASISVSRSGLTYLISVTVTSQDPKKAAVLADALVDAYIKQQVQAKISSIVAARDVIQARVSTASQAVVEAEKKLDSYILDNIDSLQNETGASNLAALRDQLDTLSKESSDDQSRLEIINRSMGSSDFATLVSSLQTEAAAALQGQWQQVNAELGDVAQNSSRAVDLRAELAKIENSLKEQAQSTANDLRSQINAQEKQSEDLRSQLRSSVLQSDLPPEVLTEIYGLRQSADIARTQYQNLLSRQQELDNLSSLQIADSRIVSRAMVPASPSYPNKQLIFAAALLLSFGLGLGLAFIREHYVGGFTTEEQVESVLHLPLATLTPRESSSSGNEEVKDGTGGRTSLANLVVESPLSTFAESIRRVRVAIEQAQYNKRKAALAAGQSMDHEDGLGTIVMMTSAVPGEGKSTMSLSLARTYAISGKKTLLIDCDLRKPSVHRYLGMEPSSGLVDFLRGSSGGSSLANLTVNDPLTGLTVLLGSRRTDFATDELFMGERIAKLLESARRHFDFIILDTPPIEPVVDGLYLARFADVVGYVIKWASTSQQSARRSTNALRANMKDDGSLLAIMNQLERTNLFGNYYYYYSGYYSD